MQERSTQRQEPTTTPQAHDQEATPGHAPAEARYVAGQVPAPAEGADGADRSASQLAYEEDGNTAELKGKVGKLVGAKFGGDLRQAFDHYDLDHDGSIDKGELLQLLKEAGVGNGVTRGAWASGIIEKLDRTGDAKIQWTEFESVAASRA